MIYKFHDDGHGEVAAEIISADDPRLPFLGLHFPEADIPKQARALYLINPFRLLPNVAYTPSPMIPTTNPINGGLTDMTHCVLRGYSKMYTEYLVNMEARASMSLAIIQRGALWGLIVGHHQSTRHIDHDVRLTCKALADVVSLQISDKMDAENAVHTERLFSLRARVEQSLQREGALIAGLAASAPGETEPIALSIFDATGCAILSGQECRLLGNTPDEAAIRSLVQRLNDTDTEISDLWAIQAISEIYPEAGPWQNIAAGLLALRISPVNLMGDWVIWFRPEIPQTVNWGGSPDKQYEAGDVLSPRKSFDVWREVVRGRCVPWTRTELDAAQQLRSGCSVMQWMSCWAATWMFLCLTLRTWPLLSNLSQIRSRTPWLRNANGTASPNSALSFPWK
jgi:light-regulated signal transduction histidine kinase (bacteriophytochrome)